MCKTKLEDKTVGIFARIAKFASSSQALGNSQTLRNLFANLANLAMQLRIWQCNCEFGNGLRSWQGYCEFGNVVCEVGKVVCEVGNAKFR